MELPDPSNDTERKRLDKAMEAAMRLNQELIDGHVRFLNRRTERAILTEVLVGVLTEAGWHDGRKKEDI